MSHVRQVKIGSLAFCMLACLLASGCAGVGEKSASVSVVYAATAAISLILLACYCWISRKKDPWFLLMFASVLVVNVGYFALSTSYTLEEALLANRIAYFGSVFLPMSMLMIIVEATKVQAPKPLPAILLLVSAAVFLVAASPGYSTVYYESVHLSFVNGASVLVKTYGPWHSLYLVYLVGYFSAMVAVIAYATLRKRVDSNVYAIVLATAVFVNIGVWFLEQMVSIDFEFLSVSYIISELFLLGLSIAVSRDPAGLDSTVVADGLAGLASDARAADQPGEGSDGRRAALESVSVAAPSAACHPRPTAEEEAAYEDFRVGLPHLTRTERAVFDLYLEGKGTREIMAALGIKENTLKFHNKNLYAKLGVSSRKQLVEVAKGAKVD